MKRLVAAMLVLSFFLVGCTPAKKEEKKDQKPAAGATEKPGEKKDK